jgi:hypothetical protein
MTTDQKNGWMADHSGVADRCAHVREEWGTDFKRPGECGGVYENRGGNREIARVTRDLRLDPHIAPAVI